MITYHHGNLLMASTDALVNTVNCVGVMGAGLALQFKQAFTNNYRAYVNACQSGNVLPGRMFVHHEPHADPKYWIINFPTKRHWRDMSILEDIQTGLDDLVKVVNDNGIKSIAIPPLGCGLGGLSWDAVHPLIIAAMEPLTTVTTRIYCRK